MLGIDGDTGSIELGKRADLVALGAGDVLEMTMAGGQIAYLVQKKALQ
jgi:imidazolonepropionase-like amidohydrolase